MNIDVNLLSEINTSRQNPAAYKKGYISWPSGIIPKMQGWFNIGRNNRMKDKSHMIIPIGE